MTDTETLSVSKLATNVQEILQRMALAASRAPSGDNLQPWSFAIDAGERCLEVWLDRETDVSNLNPAQRMSLIACGAAVESAVCAALDCGWSSVVETDAVGSHGVTRVRLGEQTGVAHDSFTRMMQARTTNRHLYDGFPLFAQTLAALRGAPSCDSQTSIHWGTRRTEIDRLSVFATRADVLLFGEASMRRAFLNNVRFDLPAGAAAERGLPLGALEISWAERTTLRLLRHTPDWLFKFTPAPYMFARYSGRLVRSSSGVCVITGENTPAGCIQAGRTMLRAWLALGAQGLVAQPMMSSVAVLQALECGSDALIHSIGLRTLRRFNDDFRQALSSLGIHGSPHWLMRFGRAPETSTRTGRLPLSQLLRERGGAPR